jgi:hypothetical protein
MGTTHLLPAGDRPGDLTPFIVLTLLVYLTALRKSRGAPLESAILGEHPEGYRLPGRPILATLAVNGYKAKRA